MDIDDDDDQQRANVEERSSASCSWWEQPALVWNYRPMPYSDSSSSEYWAVTPPGITEVRAQAQEDPGLLCKKNDDDSTTAGDDVVPSGGTTYSSFPIKMSYARFFDSTVELAAQLRVAISDEVSKSRIQEGAKQKYQRVAGELLLSVAVAVAIPEGPFLPLAMAAVHALNVPWSLLDNNNSSSSSSNHRFDEAEAPIEISAVLLPLDPADGRERLAHMLQEANPAVVLTAADCDRDTLQELINQLARSHDNNKDEVEEDSHHPLYRTSRIQVLNVRQILRQTLRTQHRKTGSSERARRPVTREETANSSLQKQLNAYAKETARTAFWKNGNTFKDDDDDCADYSSRRNRISHLVYTSGTTGQPKGCLSSINSLQNYLTAKNKFHGVTCSSSSSTVVVLLASAVTFDPCLSDVLATLTAHRTLALARRRELLENLAPTLRSLSVSHVLCTPTLWSTTLLQQQQPQTSKRNKAFPYLRVVALGGEKIPNPILRAWASPAVRNVDKMSSLDEDDDSDSFRLCATFGVTEACVYQTMGEVFATDSSSAVVGQDVGLPFEGLRVRICDERVQDSLVDVAAAVTDGHQDGGVGEVVLSGNQLDSLSSYLQRPDLTVAKFVEENGTVYYRTGDRGKIDPITSRLRIMGRIAGEDGMVKFNGVRVELGEIENAIVDCNTDQSVVVDAIVVATQQDEYSNTATNLYAYVILSPDCLMELGISSAVPDTGLLCSDGPLLTLLRERCRTSARVIPSAFIVLPRVPLSPTGKRYRRGVPSVKDAVDMATQYDSEGKGSGSVPLFAYGRTGSLVTKQIIDCLNLQSSQEKLLTTKATFGMLGGDSLGATRLVRSLYALHHGRRDSRFIGGEFGALGGPFAVVHLLSARNLGAYVDWLDKHGVCESQVVERRKEGPAGSIGVGNDNMPVEEESLPSSTTTTSDTLVLYDALLQAVTARSTRIAMALLDIGADPNQGEHGGRLGKTSGRRDRKRVFRSGPLHLACLQGEPELVAKLLKKKAKYNSPDASGLFPIHLAVASEFSQSSSTEEEDIRRLSCLRHLLEAGAPLSMKDGSQQTILHAAARSGHCRVLRFALEQWVARSPADEKRDSREWRDNWSRTALHWAVLNGNVESLRILLEMGCRANPVKLTASQMKSSIASESPIEICRRVHGDSPTGRKMADLLQAAGR